MLFQFIFAVIAVQLFKGKFYDWPSDLQEIKSVNEVISKLPATQRVCTD